MPGTGAIIATGAIDYPAGFRETAEAKLADLNVSKIMMVTCTYDHRVIQGAESGMFLARLDELLRGQQGFYDQILKTSVSTPPRRLPSRRHYQLRHCLPAPTTSPDKSR